MTDDEIRCFINANAIPITDEDYEDKETTLTHADIDEMVQRSKRGDDVIYCDKWPCHRHPHMQILYQLSDGSLEEIPEEGKRYKESGYGYKEIDG